MIRAVLDTNTHVSAVLVPNGPSAKIIMAWHQDKFILVTCPFILHEMGEVLRRPHIKNKYRGITDETIEALIFHLEEFVVVTPGKLDVEAVSTDKKDNHVLACALEGAADYIVSGDFHLQDLRVYSGINIVSPAEFLGFL